MNEAMREAMKAKAAADQALALQELLIQMVALNEKVDLLVNSMLGVKQPEPPVVTHAKKLAKHE